VTTPEALPDDIAALKRIIADMARDVVAARTEIARLKVQLARYRRVEFAGPRKSWHARPSRSSWRSKPWRPTKPSGYRPPRRRQASRARPKRKSLLTGHCPKARRAAQRNSLRAWLLSASLEHVRRQLKGSDDGNRPMVKILSAMLTDGLTAVEAACAEALASSVHSAEVVLNILARRREPRRQRRS
jgi:hypothetical protein